MQMNRRRLLGMGLAVATVPVVAAGRQTSRRRIPRANDALAEQMIQEAATLLRRHTQDAHPSPRELARGTATQLRLFAAAYGPQVDAVMRRVKEDTDFRRSLLDAYAEHHGRTQALMDQYGVNVPHSNFVSAQEVEAFIDQGGTEQASRFFAEAGEVLETAALDGALARSIGVKAPDSGYVLRYVQLGTGCQDWYVLQQTATLYVNIMCALSVIQPEFGPTCVMGGFYLTMLQLDIWFAGC